MNWFFFHTNCVIQRDYTKNSTHVVQQECDKQLDFVSFERNIILSSIDLFKIIEFSINLDLQLSIIA